MTLETRLQELATASGGGDKALRTLINGNMTDLTALATTDKSSLVNALNEIYGSISTAAGINDATTTTTSTWSSSKVSTSIATARSGAVADAIDDGTPAAGTAWSSTKTASEIDDAVAEVIDDADTASTDSTLSANAILAAISSVKSEILGGAGADYDTLKELQDLLTADNSGLADLMTAIGNRVRYDAAQSLTGPQATQARTNIGAAEAAALGNTDRDLAADFSAALI